MEEGKFIISLDFELHWGAAEKWDLKIKSKYFEETRKSIPFVLKLFDKYRIHATWATVGFLFAKNKEQLLEFIPAERPSYLNEKLSYYKLIDNDSIGNDENDDPYHYATSLISQIINTPHQEVATHTFAHYYCNEKGQSKYQFDLDLKAAQSLSEKNFNIKLQSLVFPRNQFNSDYLEIAKSNGIKVVRSNPDVWFWKNDTKYIPLARAIDTLFPISNSLTFKRKESDMNNGILLLPASRFLRPFKKKETIIQSLKFQRIKKEMSYAAKTKQSYHLWWHPHNFGYSLSENLMYLEQILKHFDHLNREYGFKSKTMIEMY